LIIHDFKLRKLVDHLIDECRKEMSDYEESEKDSDESVEN